MSELRLTESEREQFVANLRQNLGYAISPIIAATLCGHVERILDARLAGRDAAGMEARVRALADEFQRRAYEPLEALDRVTWVGALLTASRDLRAALSGPADEHPADGTGA